MRLLIRLSVHHMSSNPGLGLIPNGCAGLTVWLLILHRVAPFNWLCGKSSYQLRSTSSIGIVDQTYDIDWIVYWRIIGSWLWLFWLILNNHNFKRYEHLFNVYEPMYVCIDRVYFISKTLKYLLCVNHGRYYKYIAVPFPPGFIQVVYNLIL